jgi:DNA-binding MarR family transcriptional regulator
MPERSRAQPSAQRLLPIECIEQSDQAYLAALDECELPIGVAALVKWLILDGRREAGQKRLPKRTQRQLGQRLKLSASTVCESLRRLESSHLVSTVDGEYRLDLSLLVSLAEEAATRRAAELAPPDAAEALDCLRARQRSPRSAALGNCARSVTEETLKPVSESVSDSVRASSPLPTAAERGERDGALKDHHAWRRLQSKHFRPNLDLQALQVCFYAAVEADLIDNERDHKIRFLATAFDLAKSGKVHSPAVCLRTRVERNACWRISPEGVAWAKQWVSDPVYSEAR